MDSGTAARGARVVPGLAHGGILLEASCQRERSGSQQFRTGKRFMGSLTAFGMRRGSRFAHARKAPQLDVGLAVA